MQAGKVKNTEKSVKRGEKRETSCPAPSVKDLEIAVLFCKESAEIIAERNEKRVDFVRIRVYIIIYICFPRKDYW